MLLEKLQSILLIKQKNPGASCCLLILSILRFVYGENFDPTWVRKHMLGQISGLEAYDVDNDAGRC